ncbi:MAG: class I SAM-dependent methyltransferase [Rubricoccaceae bacterium]
MCSSPTRAPSREAPRRGLRRWAFAHLLASAASADRRLYGPRKVALLGALRGTVVELGAGAGPNAVYLAPGTRWVAVEPNVHFHGRLRQAARQHGLTLTLSAAVAERLPLADASADAVVSTLVLCSVDDVPAALAEVRRVLRPGGRFVFIEHVAAPRGTMLRAAQRLLRGPWSVLADGCRPDQDTLGAIRAAGFADVQAEAFSVPLGLVRPHVAGVALAP